MNVTGSGPTPLSRVPARGPGPCLLSLLGLNSYLSLMTHILCVQRCHSSVTGFLGLGTSIIQIVHGKAIYNYIYIQDCQNEKNARNPV